MTNHNESYGAVRYCGAVVRVLGEAFIKALIKLENNDAMVCKKTRIFWRQYVGYIDTVRHARDYKVKYVVATSGFF